MLGVILCTHSILAQGFKEAVEMIAGKQDNFDVICFMNGDDLEELKGKIDSKINEYRSQNVPVCVMVDLFAATPFNISIGLSMEKDFDVICGINLPTVLEVLLSREVMDLDNYHNSLKDIVDQSANSIKLINGKELM